MYVHVFSASICVLDFLSRDSSTDVCMGSHYHGTAVITMEYKTGMLQLW